MGLPFPDRAGSRQTNGMGIVAGMPQSCAGNVMIYNVYTEYITANFYIPVAKRAGLCYITLTSLEKHRQMFSQPVSTVSIKLDFS